MKKHIFSILTFACLLFMSRGALAQAFDHSHARFAKVLDEFVKPQAFTSKVDYAGLKQRPAALFEYLRQLSGLNSEQYQQFSENQKLAFLINAYNAFTLQLVIEHYPVESIKEIGGIFQSPWKIEFFELLGRRRSLDQLEHEMIRGTFEEPRIHFAINCASIGCPGLATEPYIAVRLDHQLDRAAQSFLGDATRNRFDPIQRKVFLSKIFDWFGNDFRKQGRSLESFLGRFSQLNEKSRAELLAGEFQIQFLEYDWRLNDLSK